MDSPNLVINVSISPRSVESQDAYLRDRQAHYPEIKEEIRDGETEQEPVRRPTILGKSLAASPERREVSTTG